MTWLYLSVGCAAVLLLAYLVVACLAPERFS
jgi:K+-transporting ATPase KdpF subunit